MRFFASYGSKPRGAARYLPEELSFDTVEHGERYCTVTLGDMYLGLDIASDQRTVCAVSGLCPANTWTETSRTPPPAPEGALLLDAEGCELVQGCGYRSPGDWRMYRDPGTRTALAARTDAQGLCADMQAVRFLQNAVAVLSGKELVAVYIEDADV